MHSLLIHCVIVIVADNLGLAKFRECGQKFVVCGRGILLAFDDLLDEILAALDHRFGKGAAADRGLI